MAILSTLPISAFADYPPIVYFGETVENETLDDGKKQNVRGIVNNTTIISGEQYIESNGVANNTTILGGRQMVFGVSNGVNITDGALAINGIANDADVINYAAHKASETTLENTLTKETKAFIYNYIKNSFDWHDLAKEWRKHQYSYDQSTFSNASSLTAGKAKKSEKAQYYNWAKEQTAAIMQLIPLSQKFMTQLDTLFQNNSLDFLAIQARIYAAYTYFFPKLDQLVHTVLYTLERIKRVKKAKTFFNELCILEEFQTNAILRLMKAKKLIDIVISEQEICKDNLDATALTAYIQAKQLQIKTEIKQNYGELLADDSSIERYTKKKAKTATIKKSTVQQTFELWQQDYSIEEIAELRKLTVTTIYDHFTKLIVANQVSLSAILPLDKVEQLHRAFQGHMTAPITALKSKYGDQFTWDELRLFKASLALEK